MCLAHAAPGRAAEQQDLPQVRAVHERADQEQQDSGEHGDRPPPPGISPYQGGCHAKRSKSNERLTGFVRHRAGASASLSQWGYPARLPRIEQDRESAEGD